MCCLHVVSTSSQLFGQVNFLLMNTDDCNEILRISEVTYCRGAGPNGRTF